MKDQIRRSTLIALNAHGEKYPQSIPVSLNRRAAARYLSLASIIPGRQRFSWNW